MFEIGKPEHSKFKIFFHKFFNKLKFWARDREHQNSLPAVKVLKYAGIILSFLFLIFITLSAIFLFTLQKAYKEANFGKQLLENTLADINHEEFEKASADAKDANSHFSKAIELTAGMNHNFLIPHIESLSNQISGMGKILQASRKLSEALEKISDMGGKLNGLLGADKTIKLSKFSPEEKKKILGFLDESAGGFEELKSDLEEAADYLESIRFTGVLILYKENIENLKAKITKGNEFLGKSIPILKILPPFLGYPEKSNFLVLLQNSDELRPTGGFLGTFSILSLENGEIINTITRDVYHLDMPVRDLLDVEPPEPLAKYLGAKKWFLRDANWSPDWPTAARKIEWFYYNEEKLIKNEKDKIGFNENFSGIIALTPEFVNGLLAITGPIIVKGETYNKDNFTRLLEYRVEQGFVKLGIPSWHRKEIISDIYEQLKIKLFDIEASRWQDIIGLIDKSLRERNVMLYMKNPELQKLVRAEDFAGEVKETKGDYFMIVDANMASAKTDAVMDKKISYKVEEIGGELLAKLKITYKHDGKFDWRTTRYRTYTRVYVPLGSQLKKVAGFTKDKIKVYKELNKTCMAGFISIEPGKSGSLYFEYKLPERFRDAIKNEDRYELYIQKQPGNNIREITADFNFNRDIANYKPNDCLECQNEKNMGKKLKWVTALNEDKEIEINF